MLILSTHRIVSSLSLLQYYSRRHLLPPRSKFGAPTSTAAVSSFSRPSSSNMSDQPRYNFWRGHPNDQMLPTQEMQEILQSIADKKKEGRLTTALQYLKNDRGDPDLLQAIQDFMGKHTSNDELPEGLRPPPSSVDNMFLTHGVSHGLDIVCTTQTTPGDVVLVERPTYFLGAVIFQSHGLTVQSLPMKKSNDILSVDVEALEEGLRDGTITPPRMIYIVPTHQNPTGHTMPLQDRWNLCRLARQYNILVAADEVYHLLDWRESGSDTKRPARFSVLDQLVVDSRLVPASDTSSPQRIGGSVSVNSFTKSFAPGVRCGWIEGSTEVIQSLVDLGYIQSQGGCAPFIGEVLRTALTGGWQERILKAWWTRIESGARCCVTPCRPSLAFEYTIDLSGDFLYG